MNIDLLVAVALFASLLVFYWFNEPKAREQERAREQRTKRN